MARISAALRGGGRKKWAISAPVSSRRGIEGATRAIPSWIGRGLVWVVEREREGAFARDRRGSCAASVPTLITSWQRTLSYLHTHTLTLSQTLTYYELILLISLDIQTSCHSHSHKCKCKIKLFLLIETRARWQTFTLEWIWLFLIKRNYKYWDDSDDFFLIGH